MREIMEDFQTTSPTAEMTREGNPKKTSRRLRRLALRRRAQGKLDEAAALASRSLRVIESAVGTTHLSLVPSLICRARIHEERGEHTQAGQRYQRAINILESAARGPEIEKLRAFSLANLAGIYRIEGRYNEAEPLY